MLGFHQFEQIEALDSHGHPMAAQFQEPRQRFAEAVKRVIAIGLESMPKRWILDVGSGVPYFASAAALFGHDVLSVDRPDKRLASAAEILGHEFVGHELTFDEPLPELPHRFDLITSLSVPLQTKGRALGMSEYARVLKVFLQRLNPGGRVLASDPQWEQARFRIPNRWRRYLRSRARIEARDQWMEFELK